MVPLRLLNVTGSKCILENYVLEELLEPPPGKKVLAQEALTIGISSFEIFEQFALQVSLTVSR